MKRIYVCIGIVVLLLAAAFYSSFRVQQFAEDISDDIDTAMEDIRKSVAIYDAKIETGNRLLDVLLTEKSLYCEQNGITLSCMADGEKLSFLEDSDLYCLFGNVVDNALKYTPPGGRVTLSAECYELFCRIRVTDSGPGIPEEEQAQVFPASTGARLCGSRMGWAWASISPGVS